MNKELIFVYNADSGKWNGYMDIMHKVFSPKTYPCNLCAITYGTFSMKQEWGEFIKTLPVKVHFLHRDEWEAEFDRKDVLPALFVKDNDNGQVFEWISAEKMNTFDLEGLKLHITQRLGELV